MAQSGLGFWKIGVTIVLTILFLAVATAIASAATIYVPDDYPTIQAAVDNATAGDTITVRDGTYTENVRVNKQLTIRSENGPANCIVDAGGSGNAITLGVDGITLDGFSAINSGSSFTDAGIKVISSSNKITGNTVSSNNWYGISLIYSNNNTISGNNVSDNKRGGISLIYSNNNTISGNNVSDNKGSGIYLDDSSNNIIKGNTLVNDGLFVRDSYQNSVEDNSVNDKPLVYLEDVSDCKVENAGQVILINCRNITVENLDLFNACIGIKLFGTVDSIIADNTVSNNLNGISLDSSSNNIISGNDVINNDCGIWLGYSQRNTISGNNVSSNNCWGIKLGSSQRNTISGNDIINNDYGIGLRFSSNKIYLNNFMNNTDNVYSYLYSTSIWNSPEEITYTYNGNTYTNYLGNYWYDYIGSDANNDGIGDTPYSINSDNNDNFPLMARFENYVGEDTTPPTVTSVSPEDGAPDVAIDTVVTAAFSEAIDSSTITTRSFTLASTPGRGWEEVPPVPPTESMVSGTVTYDSDTYTATFTPDAKLEYNHEYTATLSTAITDKAGNPLAEEYRWGFRTTKIEIGAIAKVINTGDSGLKIHKDDPTGETLKVVPDGWTFKIIGGPQYDIQDHNWWRIQEEKYEPSSIEGWVAEDFIREVSPEELVPNTPPDYFVSAQDTVEQAIEWAESKEGSSEWEGECLKFVREAFQGELIAGWTSAEAARQQLEKEGKFYTQSNCWNPPRGALVFFSALEEFQAQGHVGIYLGNGGVVHSYDKVRVDTTENGVNKGIVIVERLNKIDSYIGWAYPPVEWLGQPPDPPTLLSQYKIDETEIPVGGTTDGSTVILKGVVNDPDDDQVKLQIELRRLDEYGGDFTGEVTQESEWFSSGSEASITIFGLVPGAYHWQARAVDESDAKSDWVSFGDNSDSEVDFLVPVAKILSVPYYYQGGTKWCAPTSMSMIFKYYGHNIKSWDIAKDWSWSRDVQWWNYFEPSSGKVLEYFNRHGLPADEVSANFDTIKASIDEDKPVLLSMGGIGGIPHAVVIVGYSITGASKKVYINDPSGALMAKFEESVVGYLPYIAVQLDWNDVASYIGLGWASYAIAVGGTPSPPKGTIDIIDKSVGFWHEPATPRPQVYCWLYGLDKGLIWKHSDDHALVLDSRDYFKFYQYIDNHMRDDQTYGLEIEFAKYDGLPATPIRFTLPPVKGRNWIPPPIIMNPKPVRDILTEYGEYTITLRLWDELFTEIYDEIVFPSIEYSPSPTLRKNVKAVHEAIFEPATAEMTISYNWFGQDENGEDVYAISEIDCQSLWFVGYYWVSIESQTDTIWSDVVMAPPFGKTYSPPFTPSHFGKPCPEEMQTSEGRIKVHGYDWISVKAYGVTESEMLTIAMIVMEIMGLPTMPASPPFFSESAATYIAPDYIDTSDFPPIVIEDIEILPATLGHLCSPGELRIYDSQGRVTGLLNGEIKQEIPDSAYFNGSFLILVPSDSYRYKIVGTEAGTYDLGVISIGIEKVNAFGAADIHISPSAIHQYTIDWEALSQGEQGVTVQIDNDGDGVFEQTFTTGNTFQLPIASFTYSPAHPVVNETITFDASNSYDPDGTITKYEWNFGDGNISDTTEPIITHSYASAGDYTVNLIVTDDDGATSSTSQLINVSAAPLPVLKIEKTSSPNHVSPGGTLTYTIDYCIEGGPVTNVIIVENYPKAVTFISADPAPDAGTNNKWTLGTLSAGASGQIVIKVKVPDSRDLSFSESGSVTGEGFVMVSKDISTEQKPYSLKNVVTLSCAELSSVSASASTTVSGVPGTSLELTEHGSGIYSSDEILNLQTKNKSIMLQKSTEAEYQPTSFTFSDGFAVNFASKWTQDICARNMVMGDAMHKKIKEASYIKDETITEVGGYSTSMEFESSFYGATHIGTVSKSAKTSEDYIGEFEITWAGREECRYLFNWSRVPGNDSEKLIQFLVEVLDLDWAENATITKSVDEMSINITDDGNTATITIDENKETATVKVGDEIIYILEVRIEDDTLNIYDCKLEKMEESVSGIGYVMLDKDLASGQIQVREHGSGIYSSDMNFESGRLDKVTEAEYQSTSFNFSDGFDVNFSSKWVQGICAKNEKAGTAIHKKISDAYSMVDDTTATKSSMEFETSFNGSMHIGARTDGTRISDDYIGVFNITELIKIGKPAISTPSTPTPDWLPCPFPEP